jgi:truncated hemoglobin YjbI
VTGIHWAVVLAATALIFSVVAVVLASAAISSGLTRSAKAVQDAMTAWLERPVADDSGPATPEVRRADSWDPFDEMVNRDTEAPANRAGEWESEPPAPPVEEPVEESEPPAEARYPTGAWAVPPPMVDGLPLRDWLIHEHRRDGVWAEVVADFYNRAASVPEVADYFASTDMAQLQRHFLSMLVTITGTGLTSRMARRLYLGHLNVRNTAQEPITPAIWDAVIATLVAVLADHRVPGSALAQLGDVVAPLRPLLVIERADRNRELDR